MIDRFFKPFYQGIFLSPIDKQSARMFNFVFKMFTEGSASLPSKGLGATTQQLASSLPLGSLYLNTRVLNVNPNGKLIKGRRIIDSEKKLVEDIDFLCEQTVIAADPPSYRSLVDGLSLTTTMTKASRLSNTTGTTLSSGKIDSSIPEARSSICLYFAIDGPPPVREPILLLNGENDLSSAEASSYPPIINNVCFPSQVSLLLSFRILPSCLTQVLLLPAGFFILCSGREILGFSHCCGSSERIRRAAREISAIATAGLVLVSGYRSMEVLADVPCGLCTASASAF
jgi:hypothetical protein